MNSKTLLQVLKDMGILTNAIAVKTFLEGKKVKITGNVNSHNYGVIGTEFTITFLDTGTGSVPTYTPNADASTLTNCKKGFTAGNAIYISCLTLSAMTIKDIEDGIKANKTTIKELELQNESSKLKIQFMKENSMDEYDENVFKAYEVLQLLNKEGLTHIEKAKIIAKIIKSS